jgi:hypothetical protein
LKNQLLSELSDHKQDDNILLYDAMTASVYSLPLKAKRIFASSCYSKSFYSVMNISGMDLVILLRPATISARRTEIRLMHNPVNFV